jgi:biotin transport system substrate-specific component
MASIAQNVRVSSGARRVTGVAGVLLFAGLTAAGAAIRIPLPGTAVPLTLQTLPVLLAGVALGSWRGSCSQLVYVLAGLAGLPVWAGGASGLEHLTAAPTAGYLLGFVLAPWFVGRIAARDRQEWLRLAASTAVGTVVIFMLGCAWLAFTKGSVSVAVREGLLPFIPWALMVWGMATVTSNRLGWRAGHQAP